MAAPGWSPLGGKSRRYRNDLTGEIVSRREYDKRAGRFAPVSPHGLEGIRTPEALRVRRRQPQPPPKEPPAHFWGGWRVREFGTLEAAITFVRTLGHARALVSALGLFWRETDSGTPNKPGWTSTPTFFADQVTGADIAGWLEQHVQLGTITETAVKWRA